MKGSSSGINLGMLAGSIVCAAAAVGLTLFYLQSVEPPAPEPTTTILVTTQDLAAGDRISVAEHIGERQVPLSMAGLVESSISPDFVSTLEGQQVNRPILAGTPIAYSDLLTMLELDLRGDRRAMSIAVSGAAAVSGLVSPGDLVKLVVTRPLPEDAPAASSQLTPEEAVLMAAGSAFNRATRYESQLVLPEPLTVLAVDQELSRSRYQFDTIAANDRGSGGTVTLEVTESQALRILEATGGGDLPLTLILCPRPTTADTPNVIR